ncbi:hypothetical protein EBU91_03105 [bacterium]|nr:hypothetical protein [bacterium]
MGFRKPDVVAAEINIHCAITEANSHFNDGYTQFEIKKDLYRLKWILDDYFAKSPKFAGEDEWVQQILQKKVWEILKK